MSGPVLGTGHIVTNKSRHCCWNVASSGGRLTLVNRVQGLVFTGDWIFWSFSNWLTDVLLPWYWQCSLQGIWIILVCVKLIRFSVVSSLRAFSCNMEFPDKGNDIHGLLDGFNPPIVCGFSDFSMYSSSLTMIPEFCQASHMKLSSIRCSHPLYSTCSKKCWFLFLMTDLMSLSPHPLGCKENQPTKLTNLKCSSGWFLGLFWFKAVPLDPWIFWGRYLKNLKILYHGSSSLLSPFSQPGKWTCGETWESTFWRRGEASLHPILWALIHPSKGIRSCLYLGKSFWSPWGHWPCHWFWPMFGLVRKFFKFIGDQDFSRFLLLLLRDNPRCLHIYIPFSRKEKRGRKVQAAPFKNGSRKFHVLLPFIFHWQNFVTWLHLVQVRLARTSGYSGWPGAQILRGRRQDAEGTGNSFSVCKVRQPWNCAQRDKNSICRISS